MKYNTRTITITTPSLTEFVADDVVVDMEATELHARAIDMLLNGYNTIRKTTNDVQSDEIIETVQSLQGQFENLLLRAKGQIVKYDNLNK